MAGEEGIEPSLSVLETDVLPLNYSPIKKISAIYFILPDNIISENRKQKTDTFILLLDRFTNFSFALLCVLATKPAMAA